MSIFSGGNERSAAANGTPAWVVTFADLMSLLLAFFVLLFSFSEIDKQKFKELAGSLRDAFGVQAEVRASQTPIGNEIIAREFSPAMTTPTALNEVRQSSTAIVSRVGADDEALKRQLREQERQRIREQIARDAAAVRELLADEIDAGLVETIDDGERRVIVRILERGSFPSGSDALRPAFLPVLEKIGRTLATMDGMILVSGHTDDLPIRTQRFRSNWELSAARAVTVMQTVQQASGLPDARFRLEGYGDTHPVVPNDSAAARARNRRVEIVLERRPAAGPAADDPVDEVGG